MNLFKDIYTFITYLDIIDIIFLLAILVLLILLVTLIYFIKINRDEEDDIFDNYYNNAKKEDEIKNNELTNIVNSIEIKEENENIINEYNDEESELLDLESLTKKLQEQATNPSNIISCTEYEKDQEEKAIISYDELLKKHNKYAINYEKEEVFDDLIIKKVNLNDLENKEEVEKISEVRVISYAKEEAFLNALKELNSLLN